MNLDFYTEKEVMGGYPSFKFSPIGNIAFMQIGKTKITQEIVFKTGFGFFTGEVQAKTLTLDIQTEDKAGSNIKNITIEGFYPTMDENDDALAIFTKMEKSKHVVLLEDEGVNKLVGNTKTALRFLFSYQSGKKANEPKGYKLQFSAQSIDFPAVYCPI